MDYFDTRFSSDSIDESEQWLTQGYGNIDLDRSFTHFDERVVGDSRFSVTTAHMTGRYGFGMDPSVFIVAATTGVYNWNVDRDAGSLSAEPAMFQPEHPYLSEVTDTEIYALGLDRGSLQRTARLLFAREDFDVRFDSVRPVTAEAGRLWQRTMHLARRYAESGLLANDLVRTSTYRLMAVTSLECFRLVGDRLELRSGAERRLSVYRIATDFLRDFASLPITVEDAAEAAGASVPELVMAFRSHSPHQLTPTDYLRSIRLDAACEDLRAGDPRNGDTVRTIATRWGFPRMRTFVRIFRRAYGAHPAEVLRG